MEDLQKLVAVLKKVIEAAKGFEGSCIVSYNGEGIGSLSVSKTAESESVPTVSKYLQPLFLPKEGKSDENVVASAEAPATA